MKLFNYIRRLRLRRNHKDSMFCDLFSRKENALSLYNAINGTKYEDPNEIEVVTIKDVIYMHQKNDVSILFDNRLTLWEHQSTMNQNMPLRGLMYYAKNMDGVIAEKQWKEIYGREIVRIPTPSYYVLYNGTEGAPDRQDLRLSNAFQIPTEGYEWTAHLLNINIGHNSTIMEECPALKGYAILIQEVRNALAQGMEENKAMDYAIKRTKAAGYLVDYLNKIEAEAKDMLLTEFNEKAYEEVVREEGRAEGRAEAEEKAEREKQEIAIRLLKTGDPIEKVVACTGLTLKEVTALAAKI